MSECILSARIDISTGYGNVARGRRGGHLLAHRVAWERERGPIPVGMHVHHECGNRACVNVEHLALLTPGEHASKHHHVCGHDDWRIKADGTRRCRPCERKRERERSRERYATDPEYRQRKLDANRRRAARGAGLNPPLAKPR